jgi:ribonucleotide monophosphatase NagD (HAD superfamily)
MGLVKAHTQIWLIGDAPQDVQAAKNNGIGSIAVHTGVSDGRTLGRLKPHKLLKDLTRVKVCRTITGVLDLAASDCR